MILGCDVILIIKLKNHNKDDVIFKTYESKG